MAWITAFLLMMVLPVMMASDLPPELPGEAELSDQDGEAGVGIGDVEAEAGSVADDAAGRLEKWVRELGDNQEIWYDYEGNPIRVMPRPRRAVTGITRAERIAGIEPGPEVRVELGVVSDRHGGRTWLRPTRFYRPFMGGFGVPYFGGYGGAWVLDLYW